VWGQEALVHMIELYLNPDQDGAWDVSRLLRVCVYVCVCVCVCECVCVCVHVSVHVSVYVYV
jgi:hypothetical protein